MGQGHTENELGGRYRMEVIDILERPGLAHGVHGVHGILSGDPRELEDSR